jgi:hypothetical protein
VSFNASVFDKPAVLKNKQYYKDKQFRTLLQKSLEGLDRQKEIKESKVKYVTLL